MAWRSLLHLNGANGSTTIANAVSGGVAFAASGAAALTTSTSKFGGACLDLSTAVGDVRSASSFTFAGAFCLTFQASRTGYTGVLLGMGVPGLAGGLQLGHYVNETRLIVGAAAEISITTDASFGQPGDGFKHVVLSRDGSNVMRLCIDGVVVWSATVTETFTGRLSFGNSYNASDVAGGGTSSFYFDEILVDDADAIYTTFPFTPPVAEYVPAVGGVSISPSGIATAQAFGSPTIGTGTSNVRWYPSLGDPDYHFSPGATRVDTGTASNVQTAINAATGPVRLTNRTYTGNLLISTNGTRIEGIPGKSRISGTITLAPGVTDVQVLGVSADNGFVFPSSATPTKRITIAFTTFSRIVGSGCSLDGAFFVSVGADIHFDVASSGYVRNLRCHRPFTHGAGSDGLPGWFIHGNDTNKQCWNNVLTGIAPLGGQTVNVSVKGHRNFTLAAYGAEDYDPHTDFIQSIRVDTTDRFNGVNFMGRNEQTGGLYTNAAKSLLLYSDININTGGETALRTQLEYGPQSTASVEAEYRINSENRRTDAAIGATRLRSDDQGRMAINGAIAALTTPQADAIRDLVTWDFGTTKQWAEPTWRTIVEPAGPSWNVGLSGQPDETAAIQALIDGAANGTVELQARPYYITSPLRPKANTDLIGVGGQTVIISKNPGAHPIIEPNFLNTGGFNLIDIAFQGGTWGLRHALATSQLNSFHWIGCTFLDNTVVAHGLDNSYAWDNGVIAKCKYKRNGKIFQQLSSSTSPVDTNIAYCDKTNWIRCFAEDNTSGWHLNGANRANNLDTWYESYVRNQAGPFVQMETGGGNNEHTAINCVVENVGAGAVPMIRGLGKIFAIGGTYTASSTLQAFFTNALTLEGLTIRKGSSSAKVFQVEPENAFWANNFSQMFNCDSDAELGTLNAFPSRGRYLLGNNVLPAANAAWSKPLFAWSYNTLGTIPVTDDTRTGTLLVDGAVVAGSRYLRDDGLQVASSTQEIAPTSIASAGSFGTPSVGGFVIPTGIASQQAFGTPVVGGAINGITGIPSGEAIGAPAVGVIVAPTGIPSGGAFGLPIVTGPGAMLVVGIASAQAFGVPTVTGPYVPPPAPTSEFDIQGWNGIRPRQKVRIKSGPMPLQKAVADRARRANPPPPPGKTGARAAEREAEEAAIDGTLSDGLFAKLMKRWEAGRPEKDENEAADLHPADEFAAQVAYRLEKAGKLTPMRRRVLVHLAEEAGGEGDIWSLLMEED